MAECKTAVTPVLMHWSYRSHALSHKSVIVLFWFWFLSLLCESAVKKSHATRTDHINTKMTSYQYRSSHDKHKRLSRLSYLYKGNPYSWKDSLYIETKTWSINLSESLIYSNLTTGAVMWKKSVICWHLFCSFFLHCCMSTAVCLSLCPRHFVSWALPYLMSMAQH